jgi:alpha-L-fucosidase
MRNLITIALVLILFLVSNCQIKQPDQNTDITVMPVAQLIEINAEDTEEDIELKAAHVVPSQIQMAYLKREFAGFIHWGPNTFSRKEWGNGFESPDLFNPSSVETDQWCESMKEVGIATAVLVAKHHDGYCLWPSRYTNHSIVQSPWKNGKGDVVKDLSESCKKYDIKLGIYLSPADLYQIESSDGLYGNESKYTERIIPRQVEGRPFKDKRTFTFEVDDYNEYFMNQLFELLTEYGPVHEIWFDGAHPKRKGGQTYARTEILEMIRALAPDAAIFGRTDIRWCGNEGGLTRLSEWNIIPMPENPDNSVWPDLTNDEIGERHQLYGAKYLYYMPAEVNTSIRAGWFYRDDEQKTRTIEDVFDIYERTVGGNSVFMLNIPPNREGRFADADVDVLHKLAGLIKQTYGNNLIEGAQVAKAVQDEDLNTFWVPENKEDVLEIRLDKLVTINRFIVQESIEKYGQRIEKVVLEAEVDGEWKEVTTGTTVGYKKILRFPEVTARKFRLTIPESRHIPTVAEISAHYAPPQLLPVLIERNEDSKISLQPHWNDNFSWKRYEVQKRPETTIHYTSDGNEPSLQSPIYKKPFLLPLGGQLKARVSDGSMLGPVAGKMLGIDRSLWKAAVSSLESDKFSPANAFDGKSNSHWQSKDGQKIPQFMSIDLGKTYSIKGFTYLPKQGANKAEGMIEKAFIEVSDNGKSWKKVQDIKFGNIRNDPSCREIYFDKSVEARYFKITATTGPLGSNNVGIAEIEVLAK